MRNHIFSMGLQNPKLANYVSEMQELLSHKIHSIWGDKGQISDLFDEFNKLTLELNCRCFAGEEINFQQFDRFSKLFFEAG